jgi:hypothetical protein
VRAETRDEDQSVSAERQAVWAVLVVGGIYAWNLWVHGAWGLFTPTVFLVVLVLTTFVVPKFGRGRNGWLTVTLVQWLFVLAAVALLWLLGAVDWWLTIWLACMACFTVWAYRSAAREARVA